jgi:hypothetical protein
MSVPRKMSDSSSYGIIPETQGDGPPRYNGQLAAGVDSFVELPVNYRVP